MSQRNAVAREPAGIRVGLQLRRVGVALLLAAAFRLLPGSAGVESAAPTPTPSSTPTATATATAESTATARPSATKAPTATPSPTPQPAQDLAVAFFNNFCDRDQPLMATVFNTSATPLNGRTVRLRLFSDRGVLEEHDHYLSLEPQASINLPLANRAQAPWVKIEIVLLETPEDPNPSNDSSSCGVPQAAATELETQPTQAAAGRVPAVSGGSTGDATWRQAARSPTPQPVAQVLATRAPARTQTNSPQPSLTPIGDAGGGLASPPEGGLLASRSLMLAGVVLLAGGSSWAFYYLTRPPKNRVLKGI